MADNKNVQNQENTADKEQAKKPVAKAQVKEGGKNVKEKENLWTKTKNAVKRNKKAIVAGAIGVVTGVAGTVGVSEIGKRASERKANKNRQAYIPAEQDHSPLDPNY